MKAKAVCHYCIIFCFPSPIPYWFSVIFSTSFSFLNWFPSVYKYVIIWYSLFCFIVCSIFFSFLVLCSFVPFYFTRHSASHFRFTRFYSCVFFFFCISSSIYIACFFFHAWVFYFFFIHLYNVTVIYYCVTCSRFTYHFIYCLFFSQRAISCLINFNAFSVIN